MSFNSHTGVLRAVSLNFVKTGQLDKQVGKDLGWLAELRQLGDYGEIRHVSPRDVEEALTKATEFLTQVYQLLQDGEPDSPQPGTEIN